MDGIATNGHPAQKTALGNPLPFVQDMTKCFDDSQTTE